MLLYKSNKVGRTYEPKSSMLQRLLKMRLPALERKGMVEVVCEGWKEKWRRLEREYEKEEQS